MGIKIKKNILFITLYFIIVLSFIIILSLFVFAGENEDSCWYEGGTLYGNPQPQGMTGSYLGFTRDLVTIGPSYHGWTHKLCPMDKRWLICGNEDEDSSSEWFIDTSCYAERNYTNKFCEDGWGKYYDYCKDNETLFTYPLKHDEGNTYTTWNPEHTEQATGTISQYYCNKTSVNCTEETGGRCVKNRCNRKPATEKIKIEIKGVGIIEAEMTKDLYAYTVNLTCNITAVYIDDSRYFVDVLDNMSCNITNITRVKIGEREYSIKGEYHILGCNATLYDLDEEDRDKLKAEMHIFYRDKNWGKYENITVTPDCEFDSNTTETNCYYEFPSYIFEPFGIFDDKYYEVGCVVIASDPHEEGFGLSSNILDIYEFVRFGFKNLYPYPPLIIPPDNNTSNSSQTDDDNSGDSGNSNGDSSSSSSSSGGGGGGVGGGSGGGGGSSGIRIISSSGQNNTREQTESSGDVTKTSEQNNPPLLGQQENIVTGSAVTETKTTKIGIVALVLSFILSSGLVFVCFWLIKIK